MPAKLTEKQKRVRDTFVGDKDFEVRVDGAVVIKKGGEKVKSVDEQQSGTAGGTGCSNKPFSDSQPAPP